MDQDIAHLGLLDDEAIALDAAALEIASLDHPGVDLDPYVETLSDVTDRLVARGGSAHGAREQADALAEVLAGDLGFAGDRASYDNPDNADLIRVIDRRRGLPVSLSILYVAAARRLGWSADALNTPGHVLVRINSPAEPVLVDPFDGGALVGPERLAGILSRMIGQGREPTSAHLDAMSNRLVLVRLLLNQATRAEAAGRIERARTLFARMTVIAPSHGHVWWERARLEIALGRASDARASLSAMLEVTRDPATRMHIFAALDAVAQG